MIVINQLHPGRFGNRILHYNNLAQLGKFLNIEYNSIKYEPYKRFNLLNNFSRAHQSTIDADLIKSMNREDFKDLYFSKYKNRVVNLTPCLGELFFHFNYNTREIFETPLPEHKLSSDTVNVGVHFRGTDFREWKSESILDTDYYINCIDDTLTTNVKYYIFTDDKELPSYIEVLSYLQDKGINFKLGHSTESGGDFMEDFLQLCDTDILISSPSTFAICAGFMGREKECYHSKKWVETRISSNDHFWCGLLQADNINYKLKDII